jgi:hypothetical protein
MNITVIRRTTIIFLLLIAVAGAQYAYDATSVALSADLPAVFSPGAVHLFDLGFDSTVASFLWVKTLPEILDLFRNHTEYLSDLSYLNQVDPKLGYPYAFSVLTLPAIPTSTGFLYGVQASMVVGQAGLANADPDWRIPYYMATNEFLDFHDRKQALIYFNLAAQTPGVPYYAKRFAENFGAEQKDRDLTRGLWQTIRDTTNDPDTKIRAQAYIDRLDMFDYLEQAAVAYKKVYGSFPTDVTQLVARKIIPQLPQDPFGYSFIIDSKGQVSIDLTNPPGTQ